MYREISLPWALCCCTEAASRLAAKLFSKSVSESDPAAKEISFKSQHLSPLLQSKKIGSDVLVWLKLAWSCQSYPWHYLLSVNLFPFSCLFNRSGTLIDRFALSPFPSIAFYFILNALGWKRQVQLYNGLDAEAPFSPMCVCVGEPLKRNSYSASEGSRQRSYITIYTGCSSSAERENKYHSGCVKWIGVDLAFPAEFQSEIGLYSGLLMLNPLNWMTYLRGSTLCKM